MNTEETMTMEELSKLMDEAIRSSEVLLKEIQELTKTVRGDVSWVHNYQEKSYMKTL